VRKLPIRVLALNSLGSETDAPPVAVVISVSNRELPKTPTREAVKSDGERTRVRPVRKQGDGERLSVRSEKEQDAQCRSPRALTVYQMWRGGPGPRVREFFRRGVREAPILLR